MYTRNVMSYETIFPAICKPLSDSHRCKNCRSRLRCWSDVSPRKHNVGRAKQLTVFQDFLHSQKRHRLDASCGFYRPDASCRQQVVSSLLTSSSCIKSVNIRLAATWYLQTCCKLMKQLASSLHAVRNLQQVC